MNGMMSRAFMLKFNFDKILIVPSVSTTPTDANFSIYECGGGGGIGVLAISKVIHQFASRTLILIPQAETENVFKIVKYFCWKNINQW